MRCNITIEAWTTTNAKRKYTMRLNLLNFPHHAFSIHQRLSWHKTKRVTCHKMLVCHKIHWIIVARHRHRCQKHIRTDRLSLSLYRSKRFIYSVSTNLLACVSEFNTFCKTIIASMMRFFVLCADFSFSIFVEMQLPLFLHKIHFSLVQLDLSHAKSHDEVHDSDSRWLKCVVYFVCFEWEIYWWVPAILRFLFATNEWQRKKGKE